MTDRMNSNGGKDRIGKKAKNQNGDSNGDFLRSDTDMLDPDQLHKEYLGMEIPDGYFKASKQSILDRLSNENEVRNKQGGRIFGLRRTVAYPLAASILLLITLAIGLNRDSRVESVGGEMEQVTSIGNESADEDFFLVRSLLVDDAEIVQFTDAYLVDQVLVEAELSEQELENIFMNSLFVDDSLIDDYLQESLVEQIVL